MSDNQQLRVQMAAKASRWSRGNGIFTSPVEQVSIFHSTQSQPRTPVMYEPSIIIIFQGRKVGYCGSRIFQYDPNNYLLLTVPLPCECETFATPEQPLVGLSIRVDLQILQDLLLEIGDDALEKSSSRSCGVNPAAMTDEMLCATERLLDAMDKPLDARVLGPLIVREILYYALSGEQGASLQELVNRHSHFSQIARALRRIENQYADSISVEQLAGEVNMSVSAFHHNFKAVTSTSPLQYLKSYRLHKARMLILHDGLKASTAALKVGYESASQFSREFKRFFGVRPSDELARGRDGSLALEIGL